MTIEAEGRKMGRPATWTPERVEKLKTLAAQGLTAAEIAEALGGTTRNAVIGRIYRLGLAMKRSRASGAGSGAQKRVKRLAADRTRVKARRTEERLFEPISVPLRTKKALPTPARVAAVHAGAHAGEVVQAVLGLRDHQCKYPIGETNRSGFRFCGAPALFDTSYCEAHTKVCHPPRNNNDWYEQRRDWAAAHPRDPRARHILQTLGRRRGAG